MQEAREAFWAALADDLNTPEALAALFTLITDLNAQDDRVALTREERDAVLAFLDETDAVFACWPHEEAAGGRRGGGPDRAPQGRQGRQELGRGGPGAGQLKAMGIVLEDRKDGTVGWRRG